MLPYLRGLVSTGYDVHLVTFERGDPYPTGDWPTARWTGIRSRPGSGIPSKAADIARGILVVARLLREARLVHARSYVATAIGATAAVLARRPYVFDMRGFLGEEYVDAGYWSPGDPRSRALRLAEKVLLRGAAHIVVLTRTALQRLRGDPLYRPWAGRRPVSVIPCAVDLARFQPGQRRAGRPTLIYSGSLAIGYDLEAMLRLFGYARELRPELEFLFATRSDHARIRTAANAMLGDGVANVRTVAASFDEMPELLGRAHAAIILSRRVISKTGSSPIKVAEYLACGLPVIVSEGLGDSDTLVREHRAGHVVPTLGDNDLREGAAALVILLDDVGARARARALAEREFDLAQGIAAYDRMYSSVLGGTS